MHIFARKNKEKKDGKNEKRVVSTVVSKPVLGVALNEAVEIDKCFDEIAVPAVVRHCIDYVTNHGMELEGIYRVSPNKSRLDELEALVNSGGSRKNVLNFSDAHEAAGLLKRFLRQLPVHILTGPLRFIFETVTSKCTCDNQQPCRCNVAEQLTELLQRLPNENYCLLLYVFRHMQQIIQRQKYNKMGLAALGVLLQAILNLSRNEVRIFLLNASDETNTDQPFTPLFISVPFKPYLRPKSFADLTAKCPQDADELEDQINKQQVLLRHLNQKCLSESAGTCRKSELITDAEKSLELLKKKLSELRNWPVDKAPDVTVTLPNDTTNVLVDESPSDDFRSAVSSILLEKQLLAVQTSLKDEIAEEKKKITQLLSKLREVRSQLPPDVAKRISASRLKRTASSVSVQSFSTISHSASSDNLAEKCAADERKREELLVEVARLRHLCAELRANLEHDSMLLNNARTAAVVATYPPGLLTVAVAQQNNGATPAMKNHAAAGAQPPLISPKPSSHNILPSPARWTVATSPNTTVDADKKQLLDDKSASPLQNKTADDQDGVNVSQPNGNASEILFTGGSASKSSAKADALLVTRF